ncbi:heavy-metal-associated domain-containing protein [Siphonobacter aquaeclarae]|jgi:copper chaperone|uniref:Copper chaperone CopZ n=1 Tax=Siphonobacter aquaeclarae TaxID=563176 RepID=A0A1G9TG49_9BACT|nr:heavy-metal-associated domain-containing protein [Siphonobacter aquaeclarae]MBO9640833.1 heavy-metal-associated domain-containing protein [Siphonobacter aquaeclarae]SDM46687.1 Copper chaperone CopZ [Siphonobacter aquaeclarae]
METLQFKTNINCSNCVAKVSPFLNQEDSIDTWKVDTDNPEKILTVEGDDLDPEVIIETVEKAGFSAKEA